MFCSVNFQWGTGGETSPTYPPISHSTYPPRCSHVTQASPKDKIPLILLLLFGFRTQLVSTASLSSQQQLYCLGQWTDSAPSVNIAGEPAKVCVITMTIIITILRCKTIQITSAAAEVSTNVSSNRDSSTPAASALSGIPTYVWPIAVIVLIVLLIAVIIVAVVILLKKQKNKNRQVTVSISRTRIQSARGKDRMLCFHSEKLLNVDTYGTSLERCPD